MCCSGYYFSHLCFILRFKPVQVSQLVAPVREEFEQLFHATFSVKQNAQFLGSIQVCIRESTDSLCRDGANAQYMQYFIFVVSWGGITYIATCCMYVYVLTESPLCTNAIGMLC